MARIRPENKKLRLNLMPSMHFWLVPVVVILELMLFLAMVISGIDALSPEPMALFEWGANQRSAVMEGELWRLLTAVFIHHGIFHLVVNLIGFWLAGRILEPLIGWKNSGLLLLFCGVVSSVSSFFWHPYMLSVGASGMVYGLIGAIPVFLFTRPSYFKELVPHLFLLFVLFIVQWVFSSFSHHVDHAAHIGGALAGFFASILIRIGGSYPSAATPIRGVLGFFSLLVMSSVLVLGKQLSNPLASYQKVSKVFFYEVYQANHAWLSPKDSLAFKLGIEHLNRADEALSKADLSDMPSVLQVRIQQMELYTSLKKKQLSYYIDYLKEDGSFSMDIYRGNQEALKVLELDIMQQKRIPQE